MSANSALVAYNTSELLALRHQNRAEYDLITRGCATHLRGLGHIAPEIEIDERYLISELDAGGVSAVVLARNDLPKILGMIGARIDRVGRRFCLQVQRPYIFEHPTFYGVQRYEIYETLRQTCLRYVLEHLILFRMDTSPPVREIEWRIVGTKYSDRFRLRGTNLVRM